jgi:hypothetical protein
MSHAGGTLYSRWLEGLEACIYFNVPRLLEHSDDMGSGRLDGWRFPFRHVFEFPQPGHIQRG